MKDFIKTLRRDLISLEMLKYTAFGFLTALIDIGAYTLCYNTVPVGSVALTTISNIAAWISATIFAFFTNKLFVFNSRNTGKRKFLIEFFSFFGARFFSLAVSMVFLLLMVNAFGFDYFWSKIITSVFVIISNYIAAKAFIFKK